MKADYYYVRLNVDGEDVPIVNHCRYATDYKCRFQVSNRSMVFYIHLLFLGVFWGEWEQILRYKNQWVCFADKAQNNNFF